MGLVLEPSPLLSPYIHTCNPVEENDYQLWRWFEPNCALTLRDTGSYSALPKLTVYADRHKAFTSPFHDLLDNPLYLIRVDPQRTASVILSHLLISLLPLTHDLHPKPAI